MTDQMISADKVREVASRFRDQLEPHIPAAEYEVWERATEAVEALLLPTLADMAPRERAACKWMQADIIGGDEPLVITRIDRTDGTAIILDRNGRLDGVPSEHVTPRPDLPRMTWPGDREVAPAPALPEGWRLADHPQHGSGIVTRPVPDRNGYVCFVFHSDGTLGHSWHFCTPDELTFLDQETDTAGTVQPNTLAVGGEWHDADALARACRESGRDQIIALDADGDAFVWWHGAEWWEGSAPPLVAPYTIIHTGRKAEQ